MVDFYDIWVIMILTMLPTSVFAAEIDRPKVYFEKHNNIPVRWYFEADDANSVTLWTTVSMGINYYDSEHDDWSGLELCTWLRGTFLNDAFTPAEQEEMVAYGNTEALNSMNIS